MVFRKLIYNEIIHQELQYIQNVPGTYWVNGQILQTNQNTN